MPSQQTGPNASADVSAINDVGGSQYSVNGNEVFQIFDLYITVNTHNKIIAGNNNTFNLGTSDTDGALITRKTNIYIQYIEIY